MQIAPGTKWYSVYSQKGEHQASYDQSFKDSYGWALDCARHVGGYICECGVDKEEEVVFNTLKKQS